MKNNLSLDNLWHDFTEIPIYNWNEVATKGDLSALIKEGEYNYEKLEKVWIDLQQQHFDEFGVEAEVEEYARTMQKLIKLNKEFIKTRNRVLLNFIEIEEINLHKETVNYKFHDILDAVEKYKGFQIDPKQYPAIKWFYSLKNMSKKVSNG